MASSSNKKATLKPGKVFIFSNQDQSATPYNDLYIDVSSVVSLFEGFQMDVQLIENVKRRDVEKCIEKCKGQKGLACIVIVMIADFDNNYVNSRDLYFNVNDNLIQPIIQIDTLEDIPKIFIFNGCAYNMNTNMAFFGSAPDEAASEILMFHTRFYGKWFDGDIGSHTFRILCEHLKRDGHHKDIESIMRDVRIAAEQDQRVDEVPLTTSSMTKPFILGKKE